MRRSAIESLQRGLTSTVANWELVVAHVVQTMVVSLLAVAGAVPFILVVGVGTVRLLWAPDLGGAGKPEEVLGELAASLTNATGPLVTATVVAFLVWTIAIIVHSYFQAGIFGVLAEADRRAIGLPLRRHNLRSFSTARFRALADRGLWTFFWLINLFMLIGVCVVAVAAALVLLTAWFTARDSVGLAIALGCSGGFVAAIVAIGTGLWWQLAMASEVSGAVGLRRASSTGLRVLVRRAGGVSVLVLLAVVAFMALAFVFVPVGLVVEVAARESLSVYITAQILMTVIQSAVSSVLSVALAGTFVALARGEIDTGVVAT